MKYRHVTEQEDYSPYASGQILYGIRGHPPLPVRLASEIFLRAHHIWNQPDKTTCTLYDPMCGSGATLVTLKFLHWDLIDTVLGSDIAPESLEIAALNFGLLTQHGLQARMAKIADRLDEASSNSALDMARDLLRRIKGPVTTQVFRADATDKQTVQAGIGDYKVDIAFLDIPYGRMASWQGQAGELSSQDAAKMVLDALLPVMAPAGVVALFMPKKHQFQVDPYRRIQRVKAGKREVWLLQSPPDAK